jgi:hypothetical protein
VKSISIEQLLQQSITLNVNPVGFDYNLGSKEKTRKKKQLKIWLMSKMIFKNTFWADSIKHMSLKFLHVCNLK